ncbi:SDR family NAD(P)-dependent oxidoreductase [Nocardia sp. NPDC088792]|uniref:SDR family NAD(P)-dependent oxidoreductase n=1 Tax=Nocardia sp. NPDC088792 TaxID=3364332 RepID=UPI0038076D50
MIGFDGRRVVVTGAGAGIGRATTLHLLAEGADVVAAGRGAEGLKETAALAEHSGNDARLRTMVLDVSDPRAVQAVFAEAISGMGGLDVLVNSAGVFFGAHTHEASLESWHETIATNLTGTFLTTRAALPALLGGREPVVVNIGSTAASAASPYMAAYAASKGGVQAFTRTIALEYANRGLRAVCVLPGGIDAKMTVAPPFPADIDRTLLTRLRPVLGGGALGAPAAVARIIVTLASPDSAFITGTEIRVDGGAHM